MNTNQEIRKLSDRLILHAEDHFNNFRSRDILAQLKQIAGNKDEDCVGCLKRSSSPEVLRELKKLEKHLKAYDYVFDVFNHRDTGEYRKRMMKRPMEMFISNTRSILQHLALMVRQHQLR